MSLRRRAGPTAALLAGLAACAGAPPRPAPVELVLAPGAEAPASLRARAAGLAGAYVRVTVLGVAGRDDDNPNERTEGALNAGSGTIVDPRGYVATAAHIAMRVGLRARVHSLDGRVHEGRVVAVAPRRELALVRIAPYPGMLAPTLAPPEELRRGDPVLGIGGTEYGPATVTAGRVRRARRARRIEYGGYGYDRAIEIEMRVAPGHSGGPVFDREGRLAGMIASFAYSRTGAADPGVAFAVPAADIARFVREVAGRDARTLGPGRRPAGAAAVRAESRRITVAGRERARRGTRGERGSATRRSPGSRTAGPRAGARP